MNRNKHYVTEAIRAIYMTNGMATIDESYSGFDILRPFTFNEYRILKNRLGNKVGLLKESTVSKISEQEEYNIYVNKVKFLQKYKRVRLNESIKYKNVFLSNKKRKLSLRDIKEYRNSLDSDELFESEVKVKNPETGRNILAKSAISSGPDHPAYKTAKKALAKTGGDDKEKNSEEGDNHGHDDSSAKEIVATAVADGLAKAFAGGTAATMSKVVKKAGKKFKKGLKNYKEASKKEGGLKKKIKKDIGGAVEKVKGMPDKVKDKVKKLDPKKAADVIVSLKSKEGRQAMGNMIKEGGKQVLNGAKKVKDAMVHEAKHIADGYKEAGQAIKQIAKDPKSIKNPDVQKKLAKGFESAVHTGVWAMSIAASTTGVGALDVAGKVASISLQDAGVVDALLQAHVIHGLQSKGYILSEISQKSNFRYLVEQEIDDFVKNSDNLDEVVLAEIGNIMTKKENLEEQIPQDKYEEVIDKHIESMNTYEKEVELLKKKGINLKGNKTKSNEIISPKRFKEYFGNKR